MLVRSFATISVLALGLLPCQGQAVTPPAKSSVADGAYSSLSLLSSSKIGKIRELLVVNGEKPAILRQNAEAIKSLKEYAHRQIAILPQVFPENKSKLEVLSADYLAKMDKYATEITWEKLEPTIIKSYADNFTDEEINSLIVFYRSSAGEALVKKNIHLSKAKQESIAALESQVVPQTFQETDKLQKAVQELSPPVPKRPTTSSASQ